MILQMDNDVLTLAITDRSTLYSSYMSFLPNGGLFIPTKQSYELGDSLCLLLQLMDGVNKIPVEGRVVWITPQGAQGNKVVGVGVGFDQGGEQAKAIIEGHLASFPSSSRLTFTM